MDRDEFDEAILGSFTNCDFCHSGFRGNDTLTKSQSVSTRSICSRRAFIKTTAGAGVCLLMGRGSESQSSTAADSSNQIGMLVDITRCVGCRACERACNDKNTLNKFTGLDSVWNGGIHSLTYDKWTAVNLEDRENVLGPAPVKKQCMHCLDPACVSVCPVGALQKLPNGAVVYRKERCIGCRYCIFACPFGIPKFDWESVLTPVVGKCQFCAQHSVFEGPACAGVCPTGALKFGKREDLLFEARARIHGRPDRYMARIFGEKEAGGTAWLYLSSRPFEKLGFAKGLPDRSLPSFTRVALQIIPFAVAVLASVFGLLAFTIREEKHEARAS